MTHPTLAELRKWLKVINDELAVPPGSYSSDTQRAADELKLITAYRDMAIKAGEWPCKCGHQEHIRRLGAGYCAETRGCPCPEYRPESL